MLRHLKERGYATSGPVAELVLRLRIYVRITRRFRKPVVPTCRFTYGLLVVGNLPELIWKIEEFRISAPQPKILVPSSDAG